MKEKISNKNYATASRYGMTESDYILFKAEITGIESPTGVYKKRLRVYFKNSGTNLKHYMLKYFSSYFKSVDNDYAKSRVEFICDSEETRNNLASIISAIRNDVPYEIPSGDPPPPPPPSGGGDPPPSGGDDYIPENPVTATGAQSNMTTYAVIAGVAILVIVLVIKLFK